MINNILLTEISLIMLEAAPGTPAVPEASESAVEKIYEAIVKVLSTPLFTYGGITITIGLLIVGLIKFFFPKNKIIIEQEKTIANLETENAELKADSAEKEARIETLERKMDVVLTYSPNKRVQDAKSIYILPNAPTPHRYNVTREHRARKKKYRVRVDKTKAMQIASQVAEEIGGVQNGE